ncbi:cysteine desulfurase [Anaerorhabdus furcosa]|uniref:Cysteine desulfurase n=1 Tax=Anaerorhabdus furcosa TaxID=118967 RepID=A0A1T4QAR7_9FIRM|nr:cysteine desulfurase [Anaerorhabdus furcosa]
MQPKIYFDNASTTALHPEVYETYCNLLKTKFYNSDALYDASVEIQQMIEKSRLAIADTFCVRANEVLFTSGASESNNMAIKGIVFSSQDKKHIITTQIEHSSVYKTCKELEEVFGYDVTYLPVDKDGKVSASSVREALREDTVLVTIMYVNNEVGSIQPIEAIKEIVKKESHAYFHVDGVQALGKIDIDTKNIDCISFSAHKIEGLKGSGILIKKRHVPMIPLICGGQQEFGLRGGTSNALVHILFAKTLRLALDNQKKYHDLIQSHHDYLLNELNQIEGICINSPKDSVINIINFSYPQIPSEVMMNALNSHGVCVSAQSTCASKQGQPSKVLQAMGFERERANSCIRISISYHTTLDECKEFIKILKESCDKYGRV